MPYEIKKVRNEQCWTVRNTENKNIHSYCTTLEKAKAQVRLLNAIDHGWKPSGKNTKK